ncbi:NAD(P)H-binding protein [Rouxiella sp. S1S-2]|uniref:SDR family oxidoreductase n=1 Tax=Rouxiella sp. S1S-2 TaxID=2653856 RepID=UPI001265443D|nr:SDR family oxidoreductase [Rouxiella sp. S1S-2]KAB7896631.1 NAD(P)H-binding protein [Rouxiella sp. S1S-2]
MTKVAIVGAHGQIGQFIIKHLRAQGHEALGIVRKEEQVSRLRKLGAESLLLDIESATVDQLASGLKGVDAVIFAAGAGPGSSAERKRTVDYDGSVLLADAAKKAGITRYVQISAIGVDDPIKPDTDPVWKAYVEAKRDADISLRKSGLDWTIIRPGPLTDDKATGLVTLEEHAGRGEVSREDVALVAVATVVEDASIGKQWELRNGNTPIRDAVSQ